MSDLSRVKPGLKIAISGQTGCGKQAVVDLLENAFRSANKKWKYTMKEGHAETIEVVLGCGGELKPVVKPNPTCDSCRFSHTMKKEFDWCICRYSPPRRSGESIEVKKDFWCGKHEEKAVRCAMKRILLQAVLTVLWWIAYRFFDIAKVPTFCAQKTLALMYWISTTFNPAPEDD